MTAPEALAGKTLRHHAFQWHITHRCNLSCVHCYQKDRGEETGYDEALSILDKYGRFLEKNGLFGHVFLTGGEPILYGRFFDVCEEIKKRGMRLSVLTNGTLIGHKEANRLAFIGPDNVQISLDGTREVHDSVRGEGSFDRALAGIDRLKEEGVRVLVSFTAQKGNLDSFRKLYKVCREHGVDKLWWDRVVTDDAESAEKLALSTSEFRRFAKEAGKLYDRTHKKRDGTLVSCERSLQFALCREDNHGYICKAGGDMIVILADGSVMPCRRLPFVIGNVGDGELDEIIDKSPIMAQLRNAPLPEGCSECVHAEKCGGGAKCVTYGQTGELFAKDVNCFIKGGNI